MAIRDLVRPYQEQVRTKSRSERFPVHLGRLSRLVYGRQDAPGIVALMRLVPVPASRTTSPGQRKGPARGPALCLPESALAAGRLSATLVRSEADRTCARPRPAPPRRMDPHGRQAVQDAPLPHRIEREQRETTLETVEPRRSAAVDLPGSSPEPSAHARRPAHQIFPIFTYSSAFMSAVRGYA